MDKHSKLLRVGLWALVAFAVLLFLVMIIIGHSYSYNFSTSSLDDSHASIFSNLKHMNVI